MALWDSNGEDISCFCVWLASFCGLVAVEAALVRRAAAVCLILVDLSRRRGVGNPSLHLLKAWQWQWATWLGRSLGRVARTVESLGVGWFILMILARFGVGISSRSRDTVFFKCNLNIFLYTYGIL
ncbi:hypothetical protein GQ457_09G027400 [Hibiscus cannabinus]